MARSVVCILFIVCFISKAYSQSTCPPNIDFENGDFSHWECFIGTTDTVGGKNRMNLFPSAPISNRHEIISAANNPGVDVYGGFPKLCPYGGNYSVKLGNDFTNSEAEAISYTFQVPATIDTFTFTYFYAVVFEDPGHTPPEQPRFFVTAYDVITGDLINCASYDYIATSALPGFQKSPLNTSVLYKSWTPTSLQFAGMGGHTVRLEFRTADCTRGGHFGYAYMDVASACSNILATAPYCMETNSLILDAPFGFQTYTWYNSDFSAVIGSGQSMTLSPPPATSGTFYVDVIPYPGFGCRDTLQAFVTPLPVPPKPVADTVATFCQLHTATPLVARALPGHTLLWYTSATGGIGSGNPPVPSTATAGTFKFYVSQKALFGCESFRREIVVTVIPTPVPSFATNNIRQCQNGNNFVFTSTSTNLSNPGYIWSFGDGHDSSSTDKFATYSYLSSGYFTVKLTVTNENTCSAEKWDIATVIPKPTAAFVFPSLICENQTPIVLTDRSTVPLGIANINNWWWNINGNTVLGQHPASFTTVGGPLPVKLVVTTIEGCRSDTSATTLNVHYAALPDYKIGDLMCNNEIIHFTDQSTMPSGSTGDRVSQWHWTFDNSINASTQNVNTGFNTGIHTVQLIAETDRGCKSPPLDRNFEIFPKPFIKLDINDSCINAPITFTGSVLSGNVVKWNWNFGDFIAGPSTASIITRTFPYEGDYPVTVIGFDLNGCKDTIIRPFTVYDNKSFAGRDTSAPYDEPIQLNAHGEPNMLYAWSPLTGLNQGDIEQPIATLNHDQLYKLYTVTEKGCKKQTQIFIKRYAGPELYVPTAFTPNNDGKNDRLRVIPTGIQSFGFFAVYNRWGQLVYRTTNYNEGWDGTLNGARLETGTFVWVAQATDYKGRPLHRKGTVTLIR